MVLMRRTGVWRCLVVVLAGLLAWPGDCAFASPASSPAGQTTGAGGPCIGNSRPAHRSRPIIQSDPADNQDYDEADDGQDDRPATPSFHLGSPPPLNLSQGELVAIDYNVDFAGATLLERSQRWRC
jgi:hypothetical protein